MADVTVTVWLAAGYGIFLLLVGHALDLVARRTSSNTSRWRSGAFVYHEDHDAWVCPEDQWLWPQSFDPDSRVMRYRASPAVCNACPVKESCTSSDAGREVSRAVDPWPASEAERFHRGIAVAVAVLGATWPAGMLLTGPGPTGTVVLSASLAVVAIGSWPLLSHLRRTPAAFPEHVRVQMPDEAARARAVAAAREIRRRSGYRSDHDRASAYGSTRRRPGVGPVPVEIRRRARSRSDDRAATVGGEEERDRFATRWGAFEKADGEELPGGWSRRGA